MPAAPDCGYGGTTHRTPRRPLGLGVAPRPHGRHTSRPECYILTLRRPGEGFRHGRTFRLRYRRGIYYLDAGRRVELYAPTTNRLLLLPGGSYRRITNLKKHDS